MENADLILPDASVSIADWNFLPILILAILISLQIRQSIPIFVRFFMISFLLIWSMHFIMIFQFEILSRTHWSTFVMCGIFLLLAVISIIKARKSLSVYSIMFWSYFGLLSAWSILEYVWGWRLIPGPYSI
jgi:hypothetical protein